MRVKSTKKVTTKKKDLTKKKPYKPRIKSTNIRMVSVSGRKDYHQDINPDEYSNSYYIIIHPKLGFTKNQTHNFVEKIVSCYYDVSNVGYITFTLPWDGVTIHKEVRSPGFGELIRTISLENNNITFNDLLDKDFMESDRNLFFYCEIDKDNILKITEIFSFIGDETNDIVENIKKQDTKGYFLTFFEVEYYSSDDESEDDESCSS